MKVVKSPFTRPAWNCALEKYLLAERGEDFLLLYINDPSVIVGRNQSVEAEADIEYCAAHGIEIIRRPSGGGTVFHDHGNINYAFITRRTSVSILDADSVGPVIDALAAFGVQAEAGPRREITVDGKKVSGTASYSTAGRQMFHGTLLHNADLQAMSRALRGDPAQRGKRVASVPSRVMNLSSLPGLNIPTSEFFEKLADHFLAYYSQPACLQLDKDDIERIVAENNK